MTKFVFLFFIVLIFGCSKENKYISEGPPKPPGNNPPDTFHIILEKFTDTQAKIRWTNAIDPDNEPITYEIVLNDSVVAYDLDNNYYIFKNLVPDKEYSVSVFALDTHRNKRTVSQTFRTWKSLIKNVIVLKLGYDSYSFLQGIKTRDKGFLIFGFGEYYVKGRAAVFLLMKLNSNYEIEWIKEIGTEGAGSLLQCADNGYIISRGSSVVKLNSTGDEIWNCNFPEEDKLLMYSSAEDPDGNIYVTGFSSRNSSPNPVMYEYFIAKISPGGSEIWKKFGGTTVLNEPHKILVLSNGNLVLFGRAESTGATSGNSEDWKTTFWLLNTNGEGNFINQHFYLNDMGGTDMPYSFILLPGNDYFLFGTASGIIAGYDGYMDRFTKVGEDGMAVWNKEYYLNSGGYNPSVVDFDPMENGSFLILSNDDRGENITVLKPDGEIDRQIKLYGFPVGLLVKYDKEGNYVYIAKDGYIFIMNQDGYVGEQIVKK
jgi:hypothetical protein